MVYQSPFSDVKRGQTDAELLMSPSEKEVVQAPQPLPWTRLSDPADTEHQCFQSALVAASYLHCFQIQMELSVCPLFSVLYITGR